MVVLLQASPNTQNRIQGKQLMSVTDVPTTVLKLVIGGSTKMIQFHCLSNTSQRQNQQTVLVTLRRQKADNPSLSSTYKGHIDFGSADCCLLSYQ